MRKLLSGYLFRTIKSPVMWALLALAVIVSVYFTSLIFVDDMAVTVIRSEDFFYLGDNDEIYVDAGNIKQYRFESLGISASDLEKANVVPIDQEVYDVLDKGVHTAYREEWVLNTFPPTLHYASAIVIAIIIPFFFGSLFSDGTMKNLVACGYSRRTIYLSALIYSFIVDSIMILLNLIVFAGFCIYYEWKPPVYIPMFLVSILVEMFLVFNVSAVFVSALFASARKTVAFIVGFLMLTFVYLEANPLLGIYEKHIVDSYKSDTEYMEYSSLAKQYGFNVFDDKIDLPTLGYEVYFNGRKVISSYKFDLPAPVVTAIVTLIYLDPAFPVRGGIGIATADYLFYKSGIYAIVLASNVLWIAASSFIGMACFKKRELH